MQFIIKTIIILICSLGVNTCLLAETKAECEDKVMPNTSLAKGAGIGSLVGGAAGVASCSLFLGAIFVDFGFSYAACVTTVTTAGVVTGTAIAESSNVREMKKCRKLSAS